MRLLLLFLFLLSIACLDQLRWLRMAENAGQKYDRIKGKNTKYLFELDYIANFFPINWFKVYIFLFIPLPSVIPIVAGVFLSALLLFSGSNQRSRDKVAQLHLISILIPLCLSSLILLIPPYPLHHGRQVVELVKIRNQSTLPSLSVSFCFYAHKSRTGKVVSTIP